jgi:flagellar hook-associated protein 1 FlgK
VADLLSILANAAGSMQAQQALSGTASHNIENANTPGYARQRANLVAALPAEYVNGVFIGRGAMLGSVTQVRDQFVEAQLGGAFGSAARSSAEAGALSALTALDPDAAGGLGSAVSGFYSALSALSQNASDPGLRTAALGAARSMALSFNRTSQQIASARGAIDVQLGSLVSQVDAEARAVADLNGQISAARAGGGQPNDLLDLRQQHLDRLAELTGAAVVPTSSGDLNVVLGNGMMLVGGQQAATLSAAPDPANPPFLRIGLRGLDGSGPTPVSGASLSGTLGGLLAARDGALATAAAGVDQLAFDLAGAVNAVHASGYGLDGVTGRALLDVGASAAGAAGRMGVLLTSGSQIAASASAGATGDGSQALALVGTGSQALSGGQDVQGTLSSIISAYGVAGQQASAYSAQDAAIRDNLKTMRDSASGVSIDEELVQMQRAQRGYEAIAKVIQTADAMLETLMSLR